VDGFGDAEAAGRVLAVDDDEVEFPITHQTRQPLENNGAAGTPNHIANEQDTHATQGFLKSITSRSVSTRSRRASRSVAGTRGISCAAKAMPTAVTGFFARNALMVIS